MPNAGAQSLWRTGSRFYLQRDPITISGAAVTQPILDFGTMTVTTPNFTPTPVQLEDSDGGMIHVIAEESTKMEEVYEAKFNNLNMDMLALAFMANPPTIYDPGGGITGDPDVSGQAATAITSSPHFAAPGRLVKLADLDGTPVFGITSISAINNATSGGTALALYNTSTGAGDYQIVSLERGLIRIVATSTIVTSPGPIFITFTPRAITGLRTIYPQTSACATVGLGILVFGRCNNREQSCRVGRMSVTPTSNTFDVAKFSDLGFRIRPLFDPTLAIAPAGQFSYWLGDMPALS